MRVQAWLAVLAPLAVASCVMGYASDYVVKEDVVVPHGWVRRAPAHSDEQVPLSIALRTNANERVVDALQRTSDPDSDEYLHHRTKEEVLDLLRPAKHTQTRVLRWLMEHGIDESEISYSAAGDVLYFSASVAEASELLGGAVFNMFERRETGERSVRTTKYSVPHSVAQHIEYVGGSTTYFPSIKAHRRMAEYIGEVSWDEVAKTDTMKKPPGVPDSCNVAHVTSLCLREFYGMHNYTPQSHLSHIGIVGYLGENANYDDMRLFLQRERPDAYKGHATFDYVTLGGAHNVQNVSKAGGEANLDVQTVQGVVWPMRTTYYLTGTKPPFKKDRVTPKNTNEPYMVFLEHMMGLDDSDLPPVLTTSYGDDEQTVPEPYARRACTLMAALGLRGTSVLFSSGDEGVGGQHKEDCVSNDRRHRPTFLPEFPASCPWVTTVGATYKFDPEVVTVKNYTFITSGGGFSRYFPRPFYQEHAVHKYLSVYQGDKDENLYNPLGRAYPDVSAQGSRFVIALNGKFTLISGTSASTPLFASLVALLNDARFAQGRPSLGFLNPLLYKRLADTPGFRDVISGSAIGCGGRTGFEAQHGWDPVTGLGTPYFPELLQAVLAL
ncbi:tripeptidyl-peptidase I [Malassezia equina]|uniref:tripeptidyl-peptidase II n=1 Tax=Malassezia equina TaxID=1381935 RepID=A0AAF0IXK0_9BASI|nr:tripeptidyl-peptidase I [Malassezia equina]